MHRLYVNIYHFTQGTWAFSDFGPRGPGTNPPQITRDNCTDNLSEHNFDATEVEQKEALSVRGTKNPPILHKMRVG